MKLIKHFDFTSMQFLDPEEWNIAIGEKWPNRELQHYVDSSKNLYFDEQGLNIKATYDNGVFKSARLNTKGKFYFKYGKIDIIAKVPKGRGTWPALWMMSNDNRYGGWPRSGEIDIMEHVGNELDELYLCIHTEAYNHTKEDQYFQKVKREGISDDFQKYSLKWSEESIEYYLNDEYLGGYEKGQNGKDATEKGWPFDHPYYLLVNLAVGGSLGGNVEVDDFPQVFTVKDIKVYQ